MTGVAPEFTSRYVPFVPDGPLPPGLSVQTVRGIYRFFKTSTKDVLKAAGMRGPFTHPDLTLRRRLDDPAFRAHLATIKVSSNGLCPEFQPLMFYVAAFGPAGRLCVAAHCLSEVYELPDYRQRLMEATERGEPCQLTPEEVHEAINRRNKPSSEKQQLSWRLPGQHAHEEVCSPAASAGGPMLTLSIDLAARDQENEEDLLRNCLLYTSPSPRD